MCSCIQMDKLIAAERMIAYGSKAERCCLHQTLLNVIPSADIKEVQKLTSNFKGNFAAEDCDISLLKLCIDSQKPEIAQYFISEFGARPDKLIEVSHRNKVSA